MINYKFYNSLPKEAKLIRTEVFCDEQGFIEEFDSVDGYALHVVAYVDGEPAGTGRVFKQDDEKSRHIGRVAVLKKFRSLNVGAGIMSQLEIKAKEDGAEKTELSSQCQAQGFYEKCGYTAEGETYLDQHCPHIHMFKLL